MHGVGREEVSNHGGGLCAPYLPLYMQVCRLICSQRQSVLVPPAKPRDRGDALCCHVQLRRWVGWLLVSSHEALSVEHYCKAGH